MPIRMNGAIRLFCFSVFLTAVFAAPAFSQERPKKKLICYAGDVPNAEFIRNHIREMEQRPFDGIFVHTRKFDHAFDIQTWSAVEVQREADTLSRIAWGKFTDNFLSLHATNSQNMNWFDDAQWKVISGNLKLFTKELKAGKFAGIAFDTEQYGNNCWVYPGQYTGKSYDEVSAQVRKRGAQFMSALQEEIPEMKILSLFQLSLFGLVMDEPDRKIREEKLVTIPWHSNMALLSSFFVGMLEAAGPEITLIDGNEHSYYYDSAFDFYHKYHMIKQRAKVFVPKELWRKYDDRVQVGMSLFPDHLLGMRYDQSWTSTFISPTGRLNYLEHNTFYALTTTDEYVWSYQGDIRWFQNYQPAAGEAAPNPDGVPAGVESAMQSALAKYEQGKPLGFDITDIIAQAKAEKARHRFEVPNGN